VKASYKPTVFLSSGLLIIDSEQLATGCDFCFLKLTGCDVEIQPVEKGDCKTNISSSAQYITYLLYIAIVRCMPKKNRSIL
jgi:hypothetical protein